MRNTTAELIHIESKNHGCFHGESAVIDISLDETSASMSISHTTGRGTQMIADKKTIMPSDARRIIDDFLKLLGTRQKIAGDRSTTVYEGHVVWTIGSSKNEWHARSSELPLETVNELLMSTLDAEKKNQIQQSRIGYFNAAHEIHNAAMILVEEHQT